MLNESQQINLAKKAYKNLSYESRYAIDSWESANWVGGPLEKHFVSKDKVYDEIVEAFKPIKEHLLKTHGKTIKLYRGITLHGGFSADYVNRKILESWTEVRKDAEIFAGWRDVHYKSLIIPEIPESEIKRAVDSYKRTGYTKFNNKQYKKGSELPDFSGNMRRLINIYSSRGSFITDMWEDELESTFREEADYRIERNKKILDRGVLFSEDINIDRIFWITNNLNSKEYIVAKKF